MKEDTKRRKLMEMLGLAEVHKVHEDKKKNLNKDIEVSEDEIQSFRAVQGILYFLKAPELFTFKTCTNCNEGFFVSRKYVKCCSYTCIREELEAIGIKWTKGDDLEALANDPQVYQGNEPIWIRNLESLTKVLNILTSHTEKSEPSKI